MDQEAAEAEGRSKKQKAESRSSRQKAAGRQRLCRLMCGRFVTFRKAARFFGAVPLGFFMSFADVGHSPNSFLGLPEGQRPSTHQAA